MEMEKFSYTWKVKFSTQENDIKTLPYPSDFAGDFVSGLTWGLQVDLNPTKEECKDYLSIFLHLISSNGKKVWAEFKFSIFNNKGRKIESVKSKRSFRFAQGDNLGFDKFIKRDFLLDESNGLITNNEFEIICEITVLPNFINQTLSKDKYKVPVPKCHLLDDLQLMFENKNLCDVTFIVRNKEFKAHKAILAARSPVFLAMFQHEMQESKLNQVKITDIDPPVFEEMLHYIYTDKSPNLKAFVEDLLVAADKYQLERLKVMCANTLCEILSINKVANILVLADRHSVTELKTQALDFISTNAKDVMETKEFQSIMTSNLKLLAEAYQDLATKMTDKHQLPVSMNKLKEAQINFEELINNCKYLFSEI